MDTETMIREISAVAEKHKNDFVPTCQTNITAMCMDIIPKLEELKIYEDLDKQGRLPKLPCAIGDTVYVIDTCEEVENILDGTIYGANGEPGTATGYYCPYDLNDNCPHEDCDDCDKCRTKLAVFEDKVEGFGIYKDYIMVYTEIVNYCANIDNFGVTIFFSKSDADAALQKMNESGGQ